MDALEDGNSAPPKQGQKEREISLSMNTNDAREWRETDRPIYDDRVLVKDKKNINQKAKRKQLLRGLYSSTSFIFWILTSRSGTLGLIDAESCNTGEEEKEKGDQLSTYEQ
ncbi:hypothetical protein PABG_11831 [Paracoccidioides brasiliensis Pb03]|nr:hypothetical protein PABG_11831 [Paracoccidioides brasiliensis Pb03]